MACISPEPVVQVEGTVGKAFRGTVRPGSQFHQLCASTRHPQFVQPGTELVEEIGPHAALVGGH
jgi:hypothetical protein